MELISIKQVSLDYGISRRMLCYYEQIGLIKSSRINDSAYRLYNEEAIKQLQQIIILRKLQIPMKQIKDILNNPTAVAVIEIFKQNINELDEQITALSTVKSILARFIDELQTKTDVHLKPDLLTDKTMLTLVSTLPFSENKIKENISMEELNKASETLSKMNPPKTFTYKALHDEFLFVGKLYTDEKMDFAKWYDDFIESGGFDKIAPRHKNQDENYLSNENFLTIHVMVPDYWTVYIGTISDGITEAPDGYLLHKFPAGEFLVVSTDWQLTDTDANEAIDQINHTSAIPNGYVDDKSTYLCIEKFYNCPERGQLWERWFPIKKAE